MLETFSIGQVAQRLGLSIDTLRYYDKVGLMPFVKRDHAGRRQFTQDNLQLLQMIIDLRKAGVPVKQIAHFVSWRLDGDDSLAERYDFLNQHEHVLEQQIAQLEASLAYLRFKKWYYRTALAAGTEQIHLDPKTHTVSQETYARYAELRAQGYSAKDLGNTTN